MWDGGTPSILQTACSLNGHKRNGRNAKGVLTSWDPMLHRQLFKAAFGDETVYQPDDKASSQFMLMMVSANSKYDKVKRGETAFTLPRA